MYQVVEFDNGDVEVVPKSWIKNNMVPWARTARAFAQKNFKPKACWKTYKCKTRYKDLCFSTYTEATAKCNALLYKTDSSDQSDDNLNVRRRKKKDHEHSEFEYFEDSDVDEMPSDLNSLLDESDSTITESNNQKSDSVKLTKTGKTEDEHTSPQNNNNLSFSSKESALSENSNQQRLDSTLVNANDSIDITNLFQPVCNCSDLKDVFYQEIHALKSEIQEVKDALKENSKLIEKFIFQSKREWEVLKLSVQTANPKAQKTYVDEELESTFHELLPLSSTDDLTVLNELLLQEKNKNYFLEKIKRIGGKDAKATVNNIIKSCFTIEAQRKCNWSGQNKKYKLRDSKLIEILTQFILENFDTTKTDIEGHFKYIFQHSYDRYKTEAKQQK